MNRVSQAFAGAVALVLPLLAACGGGTSGSSAPTEMTLACYAGDIQKYFEQNILPGFEQKYNVKVSYLPGVSTATISKLQAEKDNPQIDVACLDDGPQAQAKSFGLLQATDPSKLPNLSHIYDVAKLPDNVGVGWALFAVGIVYNPDALQQHGIAAPQSWKDLADPRLKGHLVVDSISTTYGLYLLLMEARANGGSETNIDPGFTAMKAIKPNVITFDTTADMSTYFQQAGAWEGVWTDSEANAFVSKTHFPMKFVYPTDGAPALMATANVVKNAPHADLAEKFLNYLIGQEAQNVIATQIGFGPVNKDVQLTPDQAAKVTYGADNVAKLLHLDWTAINENRSAWTDTWNKEIEG